MRFELLMGGVEVALDGGILDGSVHTLDLPVGPGMVGLGKPVFDSMEMADAVAGVSAEAGGGPLMCGPQMETFAVEEVTYAVEQALRLGTISFDAVRHLLLRRIERRPPRLDMENYPHLPLAHVHTTQAADYMTLLVEVCA